MGYPATVDSGGVSPSIISDDWSIAGNVVTTTYTANQLTLYAFELAAQTVVTGGGCHLGATATGKTSFALYTLSGALVGGSDSGQISNVANSDVTFSYGTPLSLPPGQYFAAMSSSNGTDTYMARNAGASNKVWRGRVATNTVSGGAMPATLGALGASLSNPTFAFFTQGGI